MGRLRLAVVLLLLLIGLPCFAFHEGNTGYCEGCHALHEGEGGGVGSFLLRGVDAASTCLRCHAELGVHHNVLSDDGSSYTPGGDFFWLKQGYFWTEDGQARQSPGNSHGHSVMAAGYGLAVDGQTSVAPGGIYPAASLSCVSCHDPHGQSIGSGAEESGVNYRLLGGVGYSTAGVIFAEAAPIAVAPGYWTESDSNHVDYGSGMSEWCANCHGGMLGGAEARHPAGKAARFGADMASAYNAYVRSGDVSGSPASSYLALVPFERGVTDASRLDPTGAAGPEAGTANVMCLTCHRAHASPFRHAGRWDFSATFLVDSHPGPNDRGADGRNAYYGRDLVAEFGPYQRSLCNKCHVKD